jgi:hypothetical protein
MYWTASLNESTFTRVPKSPHFIEHRRDPVYARGSLIRFTFVQLSQTSVFINFKLASEGSCAEDKSLWEWKTSGIWLS